MVDRESPVGDGSARNEGTARVDILTHEERAPREICSMVRMLRAESDDESRDVDVDDDVEELEDEDDADKPEKLGDEVQNQQPRLLSDDEDDIDAEEDDNCGNNREADYRDERGKDNGEHPQRSGC